MHALCTVVVIITIKDGRMMFFCSRLKVMKVMKGPWFESSHLQTLISDLYLLSVKFIKNIEKRPEMAHF